ncbi:cysteine-rich receptor-like protein kinase 25 [Nymphaea colorata]|nr:cysteine-rich receptor-like protein kinase 25 [Nymphaea colorata]
MVYSVTGLIRWKIGFPLLLLSLHVDHGISTDDYIRSRCSPTGNYMAGSMFEVNMRTLFSTLTKDVPLIGFYNVTVGQGSERVYGLVQCRGDVDQQDCEACINNSTVQVVKYCPNTMDAIIWYKKCQLPYSNTDFFGRLNIEDYGSWPWVDDKAEDPKSFTKKLGHLLKNLTSVASTEPSGLMFATGNIPYNDLQTLYGLVQCTRDISLSDCSQCLDSTISRIPLTCNNSNGCEIVTGSCRVAYDTQLFYDTRTAPGTSLPSNGFKDATEYGPKFDLATIRSATTILHRQISLGKEASGQLPDGQEIAVKRLSRNMGYGPKQFDDEVQTRAKLQHKNLVRLLEGYGRDLKASNVLLDEDMNPKISDFGTGKIFQTDQTQAETIEIMGTPGYMTPEYLLEGKVSLKIDVFSFGVLLLEIISLETLEGNKSLQVVDQILEGSCDENEMLRCIHIGLLCVQEDASSRPKMCKVVAMLENSTLILPSILPPAPPIWNIRNISLGQETSSTISGIGSELGSPF